MREIDESDGEFGAWKLTDLTCPKCIGHHVVERLWESSCGGYDDYQYRCSDCGHKWWVEGPDA